MKPAQSDLKHRAAWILTWPMILCTGAIFLTAQAQSPKIEDIDAAMKGKKAETGIQWFDCKTLTVEGRGFSDTESFYDRLPERAKTAVDGKVWSLSQNSAGLAVRFTTSAKSISARWKLRDSSLAMTHMPATGKSGLDLYMKRDGKWHWVGSGKPEKFPVSEALLAKIPGGTNEFILYLPLYNGVEQVEIGVPPEAEVSAAPPRGKPIVFYGTSILQGGCASRPGMAFPAILGRWLDRPVVNLGFSGNGKMQPEVVQFIAEIDAAAFIIDCMPNMSGGIVKRTAATVSLLRETHQETPVFLVEGSPKAATFAFSRDPARPLNDELRTAYETLVQQGIPQLYYIAGDTLLGTDGEATVDGQHPSDLGMFRNAEALLPYLKSVLK